MKEWMNLGANGYWYSVTNGTTTIEVARKRSADECTEILNALERDAAFGRQCIQDDCEGAWIASSVRNKELDEIFSMLHDVASRCGVAASPAWMKSEIERIANHINSWRKATNEIHA